MPARRRRRFSETHAQAAIAARVSFGARVRASCVPTTPPAPMRPLQWPIIWPALAATSRDRARPLSPNPSVRPLRSRSNPPVLGSSSPSLEPRPRLALRSRNPKTGRAPVPRRARYLTHARCRKHIRCRKSGMSTRHLRRPHPHRCCSHSRSSERRRRSDVANAASLMTSAQVRRLLPLASRSRAELPRLPARRSARLRPRSLRPLHAIP
jgi:hypothetical protein